MKALALLALLASLTVNLNAMKPKPQTPEKPSLAEKWAAYNEAAAADRPQLQLDILAEIRELAIAQRAPRDFYLASTRYITVAERRNWKVRDSVRADFARQVQAFDEPIVTYHWMRFYANRSSDYLLEYVQKEADRFKGQHNPAFYSTDALGGQLKKHIADDYEYVLWNLLPMRSMDYDKPEKDALWQALDACLTCAYPSRAYLRYYTLSHQGDSPAKRGALQAMADQYAGKGLSFYPRADLCRLREGDLNRDPKSTSEQYRELYEQCLRFESDRAALQGEEAEMAEPCKGPKQTIDRLTARDLSVLAGGDSILVRFRNLDKAKVSLHAQTDKGLGRALKRWRVKNGTGSFYLVDTEKLAIPVLEDGAYVIKARSDDDEAAVEYRQYTLSMAKRNDADGYRVYVTDFITGKPIPSATFTLVEAGKKVLTQTLKLDGFTLLPEAFNVRIDRDNDQYRYLYCTWKDADGILRRCENMTVTLPWRMDGRFRDRMIDDAGCRVLRDRGAYNPGDEMQLKIILFRGNYVDQMAVQPNEKLVVTLLNAEDKEVEKKELVTNEFGSAATSFILPVDQKNGMFSVRVSNDSRTLARQSFRVDEFVLPTFGLTFDPQDKLYLPGSDVRVSGKVFAYSGHSLKGATLRFHVKRYSTVVYETLTHPSDDGSFTCWFPAAGPGYYEVTALVADATGETQEFTNYYYINNNIRVTVDPQDGADGEFVLKSDNDNAGLYRWGWRNPMQEPTRAIVKGTAGRYTLTVRDADGNQVPNPLSWQLKNEQDAVLSSGSATSGETVELDFSSLPGGLYTLLATSAVEGTDVHAENACKILYIKDKVVDAPVRRVYLNGPAEVEAGGDIALDFGTADGPVWAVVTLFDNHRKILETRQMYLDGARGTADTMAAIAFPYLDTYPDAVRLSIFYFKYGQAVSYDRQYTRRRTLLDLPLRLQAYTNPALPGTRYTLTLETAPGTEALAAVYDKSIDAIAPNNWSPVLLHGFSADDIDLDSSCGYITGLNPETRVQTQEENAYREPVGTKGLLRKAGGVVEEAPLPMMLEANAVERSAATYDMEDAVEESDAVSDVPIRSKFETALTFQPFLQADADGRITFSFRTSDKLSTYYIHVYAHDKAMRNAVLREEMVVSLPVKVSLLDPGYLYEGDVLRPSVSVSNHADEAVSGTLRLYVYPGGDTQALKPVSVQSVPLTLAPGDETAASFEVQAQGASVGLKAVFEADRYSDALFVEVPVRGRMQTLTESHSAVVLPGMSEKEVLARLRKAFVNVKGSAADYSEITVLDMVRDAIPGKVEPAGKDVLSLSEAYYMRLLAATLDQRKDPADDLLTKIMACRNADGGFGWFEGMQSSRMITAVMLERFARLRDRGYDVPDMEETVRYLDRTHFDRKLPYWCGWISDAQYMYIRSFYTEVPFAAKGDAKLLKTFRADAAEYLTPSGKEGRGLVGQILAKARRLRTLQNLAADPAGNKLAEAWGIKGLTGQKLTDSRKADLLSLTEYAVAHQNGGMYYPNAVMPWRGLLETEAYAHSVLADLLSANGQESIADGIRIWLMLQKETQHWDTEPAFVDAVTSIMDASDEVLATKVMVLKATYTKPYVEVKASGNGFTLERRFYRIVTEEEVYNDRTEEQNRQVDVRQEIRPGDLLHRGEKIVAEYRIWNEENRSFVRLQAFREATLRPVDQLSGYYGWRFRPFYVGGYSFSPQGYREVKADRTLYSFDSYPEENTTVTEEFFVTQDGVFTAPVIEIESLYAPHYRANAGYTRPLEVR